MTEDYCTRDGATRLAMRIGAYWMEQGYAMPEFVVQSVGWARPGNVIHAIRSDMMNGMPVRAKQ